MALGINPSLESGVCGYTWRVARAGTNKLKCQKKYHPLVAHLTKNLRRAPLFGGTLTAYNFGQNGQSCNFLGQSSSQRSHGSGEEKNWFLTFFDCVEGQNVSLPPNLHPNLVLLRHFLIHWTLNPHNFGQSGWNADFFLPITKPPKWQFQGGKSFYHLDTFCPCSGPYHAATVNQNCRFEPLQQHISGQNETL